MMAASTGGSRERTALTKGAKEKIDPYAIEAQLVEEDKTIYIALFALQLLPSLSMLLHYKYASFLYFGLLAVSTVYLGSKRQDIPNERTFITTRQAFTAPVLSSVSLFGIFLVLKYTDVSLGIAYQYVTTFLGVGAAISIVPPVLRDILPKSVASLPVSGPLDALFTEDQGSVTDGESDGQPFLDFSELVVLLSAVTAAVVYVNPDVALSAKFLIPNILAWCIGMQTIGLISISSFTTAAVLLAGLFCYDIFWVFGTEVMMTVATRIEAPVKFLFPSLSDPSRAYPFSVLGLGDIVIPATFCTLMRSFDQHLDRIREAEAAAARALTDQVANKNPVALWLDSILGADKKTIQTADGGGGRLATMSAKSVSRGGGAAGLPVSAPGVVSQEGGRSYFDNSVAAYALGLSLCFAVNFISKSGQPALLYLNPFLLASAFATAVANGDGELQQLLAYSRRPPSDGEEEEDTGR